MYSATAVTFAMNGLAWIFYRRVGTNFVLKIEFDVLKKSFIVTSPTKSLLDFGSPKELIVDAKNFKMLTKDKQTLDCLYYDTNSGAKFATINRGLWYN